MNNSITIVGYVGQAPHAVTFGDSGNKVVKFSVAVREFASNDGADKTMWIDVDAWNGLGDRVLKGISKGREVLVTGRLAMSSFTKEIDGVKVQVTKPVVKLSSFFLCGKKPAPAKDASDDSPNADPAEG